MKLNINGLTVYLNGDKNKRPIVLVHAFPHDNRMWKNQVEYFSKDYFVVTYDIRGFGESHDEHGQLTMEMFVDDLIFIVNELGLEKPILAALSMGGYISLRTMEKAGELFSALILMDTRSESDDNNGKLKRANAVKEINEIGVEKFSKLFVEHCLWEQTIAQKPEVFKWAVEIVTSQTAIGVKGALLAMVGRNDTTESLGNIKIPTLVLCGEHDALTPVNVMKEMANKIPSSKFVIIENSGHMSNMEQQEAVNSEIEKFLKENNL